MCQVKQEEMGTDRRGFENFRSHMTDDCGDIPEQFVQSHADLLSDIPGLQDEPPSLHRALSESKQQGKRSLRMMKKDIQMMCIDERWKSFLKVEEEVSDRDEELWPIWDGPQPKDMAVAGWERVNSNKAQCSYCKVTARNWSPTDDAWMKHKVLSPCCRRLRQVGDEGIHPCPMGKIRLNHSYSSFYELTRPQ